MAHHGLALLVPLVLAAAGYSAPCLGADPAPVPAHGRPFFMPESRRQAIRKLIETEAWARKEHERISKAVLAAYARLGTPEFTRQTGWEEDAFWAAFLYALEGRREYLEVAAAWLKHVYGSDSRLTRRARETLADPQYWKGGEREVDWYRLDIEGYVAFDWLYNGLSEADREYLHTNLRLETEYRMACMDSWGSTPNLNFKPIFMVAFAGMALGDAHIVDWGWRRARRQGSFYSMMDQMLQDGGAWHEAAIYAVAHSGLWCVNTMAFYRGILEGRDVFDAKTPSGASARGMTDYFIDTAYPIERTGAGRGRIRVVTYGDGSTSPPHDGGGEHDMFIGGEHPNPGRLLTHMRDGLIMAYAASGDARYAPFIALYPDYKPNLWDHPPLPEHPAWPAAPSRLFPEFGMAMLRSDESPGYFENPRAMAAFLMMTKPYGHDQPDKFHLNFFGADRLLYPDYLRMQYENRAIGWTYTSASHNLVLVDEMDTGVAQPHIRYDFAPGVKFVAVSASGLFPSVRQTRALLLTGEYLLDLFRLESKTPRTYDYVLHSMGQPRPVSPREFGEDGGFSRKYWALDNPRQARTGDAWSLDFVVKADRPAQPVVGLGDAWYEHEARVRVTMAADPDTRVCCGTWGDGQYVERAAAVLACANAPSPVHADSAVKLVHRGAVKIGMLVARREGRRGVLFASTHEPFANEEIPRLRSIAALAETDRAAVVRIEAEDFTDYAAVAWGDDDGSRRHVLAAGDGLVFVFRNYGWLRVPKRGAAFGHGGWDAVAVPGNTDRFVMNGRETPADIRDGRTGFGRLPDRLPPAETPPPECPLAVAVRPSTLRMFAADRRTVSLSVVNALDVPVTGAVAFEPEPGLKAIPPRQAFGPLQPGAAAEVRAEMESDGSFQGRMILPFRVLYRRGADGAEIATAYRPLEVIMGGALRPDTSTRFLSQMFEGAEMSARFETSGLVTYLADAEGAVRLDGAPLYTMRDLKGVLHFGEEAPVLPSIWWGLNAGASSHHKIGGPRVNLSFLPDRIAAIRLNRVRTPQEAYVFTIPGRWISPQGEPSWRRIVAVGPDGGRFDAPPDTEAPIAAAELGFPGAARHIAFRFDPPLRVKIEGLKMEFVLRRPAPEGPEDQWSVGFCRPGELDAWLKR